MTVKSKRSQTAEKAGTSVTAAPYDVAVIGCGIVGACAARELSKYSARVIVLEKESDVASGSSKANSGIIHAGYDAVPGSLMAKYNVRGSEMYAGLAEKLHFDYAPIGSLVVAFDQSGVELLKKLLERGKKNGVKKLRIVEQEELRRMEPNISEEALAALYAPTAATVSPYQTTWAVAESAVINGVTVLRNTMVHAIDVPGKTPPAKPAVSAAAVPAKSAGPAHSGSENFILHTSAGDIQARYVINAAGLASDKISRLAGARDFKIVQRRGEYCLLDSNNRALVNHVLFQTPTKLGKGILVTRTTDGNILVGPSADTLDGADLYNTETTASGQDAVFRTAQLTIPELPRRNIINSFAGIRALAYVPAASADKAAGKKESAPVSGNDTVSAAETAAYVPLDDFIVEEDAAVKHFFNAAGICSPGLSAAPAIAEGLVELLQKAGFKAAKKAKFIEGRAGIPRFSTATPEEKAALCKKDARFGQIICRCEMVTEGEIVAAIHSPIGATDLDGVKRRTRAGMGRCQSGFCSPRVTAILSRELNVPMIAVTKKGGTSYVLSEKTRDTVPDIPAPEAR